MNFEEVLSDTLQCLWKNSLTPIENIAYLHNFSNQNNDGHKQNHLLLPMLSGKAFPQPLLKLVRFHYDVPQSHSSIRPPFVIPEINKKPTSMSCHEKHKREIYNS